MTEAKYNPESCEKCRYFSALENACCYNGRTRCIKDEQFPSASQLADVDRAVSLNAVMDILNKIQADIEDGEGYDYHKWKSIVDELPSVTPQRPKGHWIGVSCYDAFGGDYETWMAHGNPIAYHYCSECKEECYIDEDGKEILSDFCPFCGSYNGGNNNGNE